MAIINSFLRDTFTLERMSESVNKYGQTVYGETVQIKGYKTVTEKWVQTETEATKTTTIIYYTSERMNAGDKIDGHVLKTAMYDSVLNVYKGTV